MIRSWLALIICIRNNLRHEMQNARKDFSCDREAVGWQVSGGLSLVFHLPLGPVGPGLLKN